MLLLIIFGSILLLGFVGLILEKVFYNINCEWEKKADAYYWSEQKELYNKYRKKEMKYYHPKSLLVIFFSLKKLETIHTFFFLLLQL